MLHFPSIYKHWVVAYEVIACESIPVDTGRKLSVHKVFRTSYVRSIYVLCLPGSGCLYSYLYSYGCLCNKRFLCIIFVDWHSSDTHIDIFHFFTFFFCRQPCGCSGRFGFYGFYEWLILFWDQFFLKYWRTKSVYVGYKNLHLTLRVYLDRFCLW